MHRPSPHVAPKRQSRSERHSSAHTPPRHTPSTQSRSSTHGRSTTRHPPSTQLVPGVQSAESLHELTHCAATHAVPVGQSASPPHDASRGRRHDPNPESSARQTEPTGQSRVDAHSVRHAWSRHTSGWSHWLVREHSAERPSGASAQPITNNTTATTRFTEDTSPEAWARSSPPTWGGARVCRGRHRIVRSSTPHPRTLRIQTRAEPRARWARHRRS